jgi:demethylmenaquinone methyltransferase / 2-methoxy-6-polyprenyl-1,4-benzoquinol methylase
MANTYFEPGSLRAEKVGELFSRIAPRYDLINDVQSFGLHRYWKRRLIELSQAAPGACALDVCCGTGDLAFGLAGRGARVTGLDFSPEMLEVARRRKSGIAGATPGGARREPGDSGEGTNFGVRSLYFIRGDAMQIPFAEQSFDIVTVGYGLRNLARWQGGLEEMARVAKPGGRLLALDFGKPDAALWRWCYFTYLRLCVPWLGRIFAGSAAAYAYILESLKHYSAQHGVATAMEEMGMRNTRIVNLLGGVMTIN